MLGAQKPLHLRQAEERRQKLLRDLVGEQAVAVLREGRGVENLLVDRKPDEPAKQHVELQPFDQLPLRADRVEKLQQRRPQQALRRDGWTPDPLVKRRKPRVELSQRPRWSVAASPAADGSRLSAPRRRRKRTRPRSSDPRPASASPRLACRAQRIMRQRQTPEPSRPTSSAAC